MLRVRPGVELVRASLAPTSELITLDLPTLERPRNAISGRVGAGKCETSVAAAMNRARTLMLQFAMRSAKLARHSPLEPPGVLVRGMRQSIFRVRAASRVRLAS